MSLLQHLPLASSRMFAEASEDPWLFKFLSIVRSEILPPMITVAVSPCETLLQRLKMSRALGAGPRRAACS